MVKKTKTKKKTSKAKVSKVKKSKPTSSVVALSEQKYWAEMQQIKKRKSKKESPVESEAGEEIVVSADQSKQQRKLVIGVTIFMALVFIIWLLSLKYSISSLQNSDSDSSSKQQWSRLKQEISQSLASFKDNFRSLNNNLKAQPVDSGLLNQLSLNSNEEELAKFRDNLLQETIKDWQVYTDWEHNFSFKYPAAWQSKLQEDGVVLSQDKDWVVIVVKPKIIRPDLPADKIENVLLDSLTAQRYHDVSDDGSNAVDKVIAVLPDGKNDIYLACQGDVFEKILLTFKLTK
jgi:hypothetical protein